MSDERKVRASDDHQVADTIKRGAQVVAPRITDPGGVGWAEEPKVSQAELMLYGDWAGPVRLLGQAAVDAGDAYSLACKRANESFLEDDESLTFHDENVAVTWQLYENARAVHREVAAKAIARRRGEQPVVPFPATREQVAALSGGVEPVPASR